MKIPIVYRSFEGGWATDPKMGIKNSFAFSQAVDFRKSPSQMTVLPGMRREDAGTVKDLIQNEVMTNNGTIYAIGNSGYFYKRTTNGVWSVEARLGAGTAGLDYRKDADAIYIPETTTVSLYSTVSTTPTINLQYYGISQSLSNNTTTVGFNVNANQLGVSTSTYTVPTAINENSPNRRFFQSDIEPLNKISVYIPTKGTGDWTLTLHDGLNNVLGTKTITNANLTANKFNDFTFASQVRIYVTPNARTYHFHLTSTVADGTVSTTTAADLSACDLQIWADRLISTNNGLHPMTRFQQYECIGNGNYLSVWEPISDIPTNAEWQRHKLVFPQEYEVCGLAVFNEFIAIACQKTTTSATTDPQEGIIFFWDGTSPTYNYLTKIPEGSPLALHEYRNAIYYYAGGTWYAIGSPTTLPVKIRTMPGTDTEYSSTTAAINVYPYSATVRRGIHLMAWPSSTTSTSINYGIYSWGAVDKNYPDSFGYSYIPSTGSQNYSVSNNLTLGMAKSFGDTLHLSWRDDVNGGYGIDIVDNTSAPAVTSSWQSLILDNGMISREKTGLYIQVTHLTLPSDASYVIKYKINRATNWTSSPAFNLTNTPNKVGRFDIVNPNRFNELQVGVDITSGTSTPTITSISLVIDDNRSEGLS